MGDRQRYLPDRPEPGVATEELSRHQPRPAPPSPERGDRLRRTARRCYLAGAAILIVTFTATQVVAVVAEKSLFTSAGGQLFAVLGFVALMMLGTTMIIVGVLYTISGQAFADVERNRRRIEQVAGEVHDLGVSMRGQFNATYPMSRLAAGMPARLDRLETAMAAIAEHLPDAMLREHWRGFNEGIREDITGRRTGTDDSQRRRPQHLGLVEPRRNER